MGHQWKVSILSDQGNTSMQLITSCHSLFSKSFNLCIIVISYETSTQGECIGLTKVHAMNNCVCFRSYLEAENLMSIFYNVFRATIARFCTFWFKRIDPVSLISFYDSSTVVHFNFSITSLSLSLIHISEPTRLGMIS